MGVFVFALFALIADPSVEFEILVVVIIATLTDIGAVVFVLMTFGNISALQLFFLFLMLASWHLKLLGFAKS